MMVYINYPNPRFRIHHNSKCRFVTREGGNRRVVEVTSQNLGEVLERFIDHKITFGADRAINDLWLNISLSTPRHEESLVYIIQEMLGERYTPFRSIPIVVHC
jgi:hypothetical protein